MIISEMAIPAHTIVGALNLDTSFKIKKHIFFIAKTDNLSSTYKCNFLGADNKQ